MQLIEYRVLVTGCAGYIGLVLVRKLLEMDYEVRGLDALLYGGESLLGIINHPRFEFVRGDLREVKDVQRALDGVEAVAHVASIVGDPACAKQPDLARESNDAASRSLFDMSHETSTVCSFVFASTCSNYGKMAGDGFVT